MPIFVVILIVCAIGAVMWPDSRHHHCLPDVTPFHHYAWHDDHRLWYQLLYYDFRRRVSISGFDGGFDLRRGLLRSAASVSPISPSMR